MRVFQFAEDPTGRLGSAVSGSDGGDIRIDDQGVHVALGSPAMFSVSIPLSAIVTCDRMPDLRSATRGAHGWRGRWLVNRSGRNLVRLRLQPRVAASLSLAAIEVPTPRTRLGRMLTKRLLRDRTISLRELTLSVEDPDSFIGALMEPRKGTGRQPG